MISRRSLLSAVACLPFLGFLKPKTIGEILGNKKVEIQFQDSNPINPFAIPLPAGALRVKTNQHYSVDAEGQTLICQDLTIDYCGGPLPDEFISYAAAVLGPVPPGFKSKHFNSVDKTEKELTPLHRIKQYYVQRTFAKSNPESYYISPVEYCDPIEPYVIEVSDCKSGSQPG